MVKGTLAFKMGLLVFGPTIKVTRSAFDFEIQHSSYEKIVYVQAFAAQKLRNSGRIWSPFQQLCAPLILLQWLVSEFFACCNLRALQVLIFLTRKSVFEWAKPCWQIATKEYIFRHTDNCFILFCKWFLYHFLLLIIYNLCAIFCSSYY